MRLRCPVCSTDTESLKRYGLIHFVLFLGIAARWRAGPFTACPRCMRRRVLKDTFSPLHILAANLMWPLAIVPYNLGVMIATTIPGHSWRIRDRIEKRRGGRRRRDRGVDANGDQDGEAPPSSLAGHTAAVKVSRAANGDQGGPNACGDL